MRPDAPVTKTFMVHPFSMSVTDMNLLLMSVTVITYDRAMGRWEPNTRGRLAQIALDLFVEQGFDQTTAAQIAARAGLTERTFFRHFTDKRDVLFYGGEALEAGLAEVVADTPGSTSPMDVVRGALDRAAEAVQSNPERARLRNTVIAAHPELRERELTKMAGLSATLHRALRERGIPPETADLAAETGIAAFKVGFLRWVDGPAEARFPAVLAETFADLAELARD
jgi:AcrR family transcriptional regulator